MERRAGGGMTRGRPKSQGLTKRQAEYLDAIMDYVQKFSYPPTWSELATHAGIKNFDGNNYALNELERKGYIARMPFGKRCLRVLRNRHGQKVQLQYTEVA
jgi:SOS-response transcriptional repressor LexA